MAGCALLAINWRDAAPSRDALRMQATLDARPVVADADNAYIDALGFGAPPGVDARASGFQRLTWLRARMADASTPVVLDYPDPDVDLRAVLPAAWKTLDKACGTVGPACRSALEAHARQGDRTARLATLDRYDAMLGRQSWHEDIDLVVRAPLPGYGNLLHAQRMSMASLWLSAPTRGAVVTIDALDADLRFWRRVLASSDLLVTKMIAAAAVRHHLQWAPLVLSRVTAQGRGLTPPVELARPLALEERSLRRTLAGEWRWIQLGIRHSMPGNDVGQSGEPNWVQRLDRVLGTPFFQPQDTANRSAASMATAVAWSEASYRAVGARAPAPRTDPDASTHWSGFAYNPVGRTLIEIAGPGLRSYATQAADLEGVRRAAMAAIALRARSVQPEQVAAALAAGPWRSPYDGAPLTWDAGARCIVFVGRAPADRARTCVAY